MLVAAALAVASLHERHSGAFTRDECLNITAMFDTIAAEHDERHIPLLPNMNDTFVVNRVNRFASPSDSTFDWVYERMMAVHPTLGNQLDAFKARVAFNLLHEFEHGNANAFDWHSDSKPGDGKSRRINVNVMLSLPGDAPPADFGGGTLQVGAEMVLSQQGDLVVYAAALPHRVHPLTFGRRYTLVVALTDDVSADERDAYTTDAAGATTRSDHRQQAYWRGIEAAFNEVTSTGPLANVSKVHILHGEFLEGLPGRAEDAKSSFCRAYQVTDEAAEHASTFFADGVAALQAASGPDLGLADNYLAMAVCIGHAEAAEALQVVREALSIRAKAGHVG